MTFYAVIIRNLTNLEFYASYKVILIVFLLYVIQSPQLPSSQPLLFILAVIAGVQWSEQHHGPIRELGWSLQHAGECTGPPLENYSHTYTSRPLYSLSLSFIFPPNLHLFFLFFFLASFFSIIALFLFSSVSLRSRLILPVSLCLFSHCENGICRCEL